MPMTTWVGRKPAISSASWSATEQLSTTAAMSATVPDCMCDEALPLAADAADRPVPVVVDLEDERLGELGPDVERRAGGERLVLVALPDPAPEGHLAARLRRAAADRRRGRDRARRVGSPRPGPSAGGRRPGRRSRPPRPDQLAGRDAAGDEIVADRDEELWLVAVEAERDHARRRAAARTSFANAFIASHRLERVGVARRGGCRPDATCGGGRELGGRSVAAAPALSRRRVSRSSSWSAPRSGPGRRRPTGRRRSRRSARGRRTAAPSEASAASPVSASMRRIPEPMLRSPVMTKPPIWPLRGSACRRTARGCSRRPGPSGRARRTSRRRTRRRRRRSPRPSS